MYPASVSRLRADETAMISVEEPAIPARENRPGRRLYTLTALGGAALDEIRRASEEAARTRTRRRLAPA